MTETIAALTTLSSCLFPYLNCMQDGKTALMFASMNGNEAVCRLLLDKGADIEVKDRVSLFHVLFLSISLPYYPSSLSAPAFGLLLTGRKDGAGLCN